MKLILAWSMAVVCAICAVLILIGAVPPLALEAQALFLIFLGFSLAANLILVNKI